MCSEYTIKTDPKKIETALGIPVLNKAKNFEWGSKVKFFTDAPVIQKSRDDQIELVLKTFPTSPMPNSRLSGLEGQTDANDDQDEGHTQIKRIYDMKYWKDGFKSHPLLIPMSQFTEFAYWGPEKGSAQGFKIPNEDVMFAAGIAIKPFTPKGDAYSGFSILTHTATKQMMDYHHRLIVLLEQKKALQYLDEMTSEQRFDFLIKNRYTGKLEVEKIRTMAKGWEKRVDQQEKKLSREENYRKILKQNDVEA